jgi:hypothetical protein
MNTIKNNIPVITISGIVGIIMYSLLTTGIFATKDNVASASDVLRFESASKYVDKIDYKTDISEVKIMLGKINENVEQLRIDQAKLNHSAR